MLPKLWCWY